VVLRTGPELVAGSTRLKAGTATKMALSLLSTAAMLRLGRVRSGRMIDLVATNDKLRRRAVRIVVDLAGVGAPRARAALARRGWSVRAALAELGGSG
jgi:N-acetylmuramic acid 6-phosphate etherase